MHSSLDQLSPEDRENILADLRRCGYTVVPIATQSTEVADQIRRAGLNPVLIVGWESAPHPWYRRLLAKWRVWRGRRNG